MGSVLSPIWAFENGRCWLNWWADTQGSSGVWPWDEGKKGARMVGKPEFFALFLPPLLRPWAHWPRATAPALVLGERENSNILGGPAKSGKALPPLTECTHLSL